MTRCLTREAMVGVMTLVSGRAALVELADEAAAAVAAEQEGEVSTEPS